MDIEETPYGIYSQYGKTIHLGKILLLSELFDFMLSKLDMQDPQKSDCWYKMDIATGFLLHERGCQTARQSTGHREKFPALLRSLDTHYGLWAEDGTLQKNFG